MLYPLFSFPGSAACKIVSTLSILNVEREYPYSSEGRPAEANRGDGSGIFHFRFVLLDFLGDFPDRHEITAETAENGGCGKIKAQGHKMLLVLTEILCQVILLLD